MNLTDRVYVGVHVALTLLVCVRYQQVEHWTTYVIWNLCAIVLLVMFARKKGDSRGWEFAHDWLPAIFFISVFEEVSFLSLAIRGGWQNADLIAFESLLFAVPPIVWMHEHFAWWLVEFLEFGYFAFYPLYPVVGGLFWALRERPRFAGAFRTLTDALSIGYVFCYTTYLLFPTQSPANRLGVQQIATAHGGPFQAAVHFIQNRGGVHGNAFPSAHIMLAFVVLMFAYRFLPKVAPWLLVPILLMCVGAVYDGYHYASDVAAGALLGIVIGLYVPEQGKIPRLVAQGDAKAL
ncbi:MAG: phosphatase PAP2 family protein [Acidobacteriota bacterium]|nr:phosphatase PAP2 family protein [Acidobacteriota bacterium]